MVSNLEAALATYINAIATINLISLTLLVVLREDLGLASPGGGEGLNLAEPEGDLATHPRPLPAVDGLEMLLPLSSKPESSKKDGGLCVLILEANPSARFCCFTLAISGSPFILPHGNIASSMYFSVRYNFVHVNSHYDNKFAYSALRHLP